MPFSEHDFKNFPELPNSKMDTHYLLSPHKQILDDFHATGDEKFDHILNIYFNHRNKNLHKMKSIPIYYKENEYVMHSNDPHQGKKSAS